MLTSATTITQHTAAALQAPQAWHAQAITPYRACDLCTSGVTGIDQHRLCRHHKVAGGASAVPVIWARSATGPCGPDARHLRLSGE